MGSRVLEVGTPQNFSNLATPTIGGTVSITGTAGQFSGTLANFIVGTKLTLSGTYGGTGSITGYVNPTTYKVSVTNGTTTFTLTNLDGTAIVTTAGTPTGITYTPIIPTASGVVGPSGASIQLLGFYVNSTTSGTIVLTAANSGGAAFGGTITPAAGWNRLPLDCPKGFYATLLNAIDVTFFYSPNS
jgi:hypothetical protein